MEASFENEVLQRLTSIETKLNNGISARQNDHEKRIRFLERGLYIAIGALGLLQIGLSVLIK
jgi:hypothetical protein